ncbi:hypothetical protein FGRMN_7176 [Fusarium graminum]|nr:hypothetical protein FGRMN_7176 [Fusarium graminum]
MSENVKPPIYPRYCFHLAPTVNQWCLFRVTDIYDLDHHEGFEGENFYFYGNLPIKWVRIVGLVVAIDEFPGRRIYTIDDSSGACIECTVAVSVPTGGDGNLSLASNPFPNVDVGSVVDVKGGISTFRDERQLSIEKMVILQSTAQEVTLWEKRVKFQSEVLSHPWVLRKSEIRRCRHEAERSEHEAERKRKRLREIVESRTAKHPAKQPSKVADQNKHGTKERQPSRETRLDLRQIIEQGGRGKYDALGL